MSPDDIVDHQDVTKELINEARKVVNMVLPGFLIGYEQACHAASTRDYQTVSVRHIPCVRSGCVHIPILDMDTKIAHREALDKFAAWLDENYCPGKAVFVHCFNGIERAPLAVAYAIHKLMLPKHSFSSVYVWVRRQRPVAVDRTSWLEQSLREELLETT